jgi:NADPH:quinone reductase-like Zn-dependent oxidoreductase
MKAAFIRDYGGPERLEIDDYPDPNPEPGDVLVEIHAASVNPIDWKMREGYLRGVFDFPLPHVLGRDLSGAVTAVGAEVTDVAVGDLVWGMGNPFRDGSHAELMAIEAKLVAPKPAALSHTQAASLGVSGMTVIAALDRAAPVKAGDRVLIHAGAGGVGSLAIGLAHHRGAHVITTASAGNAEKLIELGADEVIDYKNTDFTQIVGELDIVFDTVGGDTHQRSKGVLKPGGALAYVNTGPLPDGPDRDDITLIDVRVPGGRDNFGRMAELVAEGAITPWVETEMALDQAREAYDLSQSGHARGKIVLTMR